MWTHAELYVIFQQERSVCVCVLICPFFGWYWDFVHSSRQVYLKFYTGSIKNWFEKGNLIHVQAYL